MKRYVILFLIGLLLTSFSTVSALDLKGKFAVSANGGLAVPIGDLADKEKGAAKMGLDLYGTAEYFVTQNIGVGGFFGYYSFGTDNDAMKKNMERDLGIMPDELDITQKGMTFGAFGKYLFDVHEKAAPYVKVGAGMGKPKFSGTAAVSAYGFDGDIEGKYDSKVILFGGGGVLYQVSPNVGLNLEALFLQAATKDAEGKVKLGDMPSVDDKITFNMQAITFSAAVFIFFGGK
jgi:hypothetical protein